MRIIYAGAPVFSVAPLKRILEEGYTVAAVVTQPDKPAGRKNVITPTPLKTFAEGANIPVRTYAKIRECSEDLRAFGADLMITCAYGQLLTQDVLNAFPQGVYNIHASLLPKYRGASPVSACILNGERETGITVMKTELGLDTGDMLLQKKIAIDEKDTTGTLSEKLSALGAECAVEALKLLASGRALFTPQDHAAATLVKKVKKEHALVDFAEPSASIVNKIRAMDPAPAAYCFLGGKAINLFSASLCQEEYAGRAGEVVRADKTGVYVKAGDGCVRIAELQAEGGKRLKAADFVNGRKIGAGDVLRTERV